MYTLPEETQRETDSQQTPLTLDFHYPDIYISVSSGKVYMHYNPNWVRFIHIENYIYIYIYIYIYTHISNI